MPRYTSFVAVASAGLVGCALFAVPARNSAAPIPPANPTIKIRIGLASANIKISYYNSRLQVSYGPDGKVNQTLRLKK